MRGFGFANISRSRSRFFKRDVSVTTVVAVLLSQRNKNAAARSSMRMHTNPRPRRSTMADPPAAAPAAGTPIPQFFRLSLFSTLAQSQSNHGIPHQDYNAYHKYCTKRLYRLRHHKETRTRLVHNHKYAAAAEGNKSAVKQRRHGYCARPLAPMISGNVEQDTQADDTSSDATMSNNNINSISQWHDHYAWVLVYQAERCWAQACELQAQIAAHHSPQQRKQTTNMHQHAQRKLLRATQWSQQLMQLLQQWCSDSETLLETESYLSWMQGQTALHRKDYKTAFLCFQKSLTILLQLADARISTDSSSQSTEALIQVDLWKTRAEVSLRPLVRFCGYEAKDLLDPKDLQEGQNLQCSAVNASSSSDKNGATILIRFQNENVSLDPYKQLVVLYLKIEGALANLASLTTDEQFLQLSCDVDDVLRQIKSEQAYYASLPAGPIVREKREELDTLHGYFEYSKLQVWRSQQERRLATLSEDVEIVHVYDTLLQNAQAMVDLVSLDGKNDNEDDPYWLEAQAHVLRIRAFRCFHLARLYESTLDGTPQQCLALLKQANKLLKRAREEIAACEDSMQEQQVSDYLKALDALEQDIQAMMCGMEATRYLEDESVPYGHQTNRPLWMRLNDLDGGVVLCDDTPRPMVMPCKPVFYDIAYQELGIGDFPLQEIQDYIDANEPKKKGVLGWFRS
jgi:hypothetical protein